MKKCMARHTPRRSRTAENSIIFVPPSFEIGAELQMEGGPSRVKKV
jgi:hypothetical protein